MKEICVLIITPLALEYDAVVQHLNLDTPPMVAEGAAYTIGHFSGKHQHYKVVLREPGMLPVEMALATEKAIQKFHPQIALLIGVAGGIKDVSPGDVLIANKVYGYEGGKEDKDGFKARPVAGMCSKDLLAFAQILSKNESWKDRTKENAPLAKIHFGAIAAGNKIVATVDNPTYQRIKMHYNDTLGVEMEADGFIAALQQHIGIHGLVIRGISDMCEGKTEGADTYWQPLAAKRAAAVAMELLDILNEKEIRLTNPGAPPEISHSKNVISGSVINVAGDFRLGDG